MQEHTIQINEDGSVVFLHEDAITTSFAKEGKITIERASDVSYDNAAKGWRVYKPGTREQLFEGLYPTRAEALATEKRYLEERL